MFRLLNSTLRNVTGWGVLQKSIGHWSMALILLLPGMSFSSYAGNNTIPFEQNSYKKLNDILRKHKESLLNYMATVKKKAQSVQQDNVMTTFFKAKQDYYRLSKTIEIPEDIKQKITSLKESIQQHYITNYMIFYDILFIDKNGDVFYTIRKQKDYHQNIFEGVLAETKLSKHLKNNPNESFVDFQFYKISGEPSAFFIEPVQDNKELIGWFVFQCATNKINSMFYDHEDLGKTGEVILVNKDHYMLTDSRFKAESTVLKQRLSEKNISEKFKERKGTKSVIDYQDNRVLSSFEVFSILGSEWLMIAKITEAESLTQYVLNHQKQTDPILDQITRNTSTKFHDYKPANKSVTEVDMDEFRRAGKNENLYTRGVSTCSALIINYPGKFCYMAHISPYDKVYDGKQTDLINQMLKKISYLEILNSEKTELQFTIVAVHRKSIKRILDTLLKQGFFLSQIKFMYKPDAVYANVRCTNASDDVTVDWKMSATERIFKTQRRSDFKSIGASMKDCKR